MNDTFLSRVVSLHDVGPLESSQRMLESVDLNLEARSDDREFLGAGHQAAFYMKGSVYLP